MFLRYFNLISKAKDQTLLGGIPLTWLSFLVLLTGSSKPAKALQPTHHPGWVGIPAYCGGSPEKRKGLPGGERSESRGVLRQHIVLPHQTLLGHPQVGRWFHKHLARSWPAGRSSDHLTSLHSIHQHPWPYSTGTSSQRRQAVMPGSCPFSSTCPVNCSSHVLEGLGETVGTTGTWW